MEEMVTYLKAILLVQVQALLHEDEREKLEVVLSKAGLGHGEIARILGKTSAAIQKAVSRAKSTR